MSTGLWRFVGGDSASPCAKHPMQIEDAKKL